MRFWFSLFLVTFFFVPGVVYAEALTGKVVGVHDGDTITVLTSEKKSFKIRLAEIDTPESSQPYGSRAKQELSDLVFGKDVTIIVRDTDRYGRIVGRVLTGFLDVNAEMIKRGAAWIYREYARDEVLFYLEDKARASKVGLWALPEAERIPPWEWRRQKREADTEVPQEPIATMCTMDAKMCPDGSYVSRTGAHCEFSPCPEESKKTTPLSKSGTFSCSGKRYCKQMTSCDEARFYLKQCGLFRLDGDGDGTPCESICR